MSSDPRLVQRAWYYIELFVDPKNDQTVYVLSAPFLRSDDGGKTWVVMRSPHGDHHDMWINPDDPENFILLNDGGSSITFDRGQSWSQQDNMPTAQFYRINVDNRFPYRIYGGQQDNTTMSLASRSLHGGIGVADYYDVGGGESAHIALLSDCFSQDRVRTRSWIPAWIRLMATTAVEPPTLPAVWTRSRGFPVAPTASAR